MEHNIIQRFLTGWRVQQNWKRKCWLTYPSSRPVHYQRRFLLSPQVKQHPNMMAHDYRGLRETLFFVLQSLWKGDIVGYERFSIPHWRHCAGQQLDYIEGLLCLRAIALPPDCHPLVRYLRSLVLCNLLPVRVRNIIGLVWMVVI